MKSLLIVCSFLMLSFVSHKKTKVVFFGDSITQMGINKGGYINIIEEKLTNKGIADKYELIGAGIGGNKVYDLYLRLEEDVLDKKPDIVFIYIGINDVWHKTSGIGTDIKKYEQFYSAIIKKIKKAGARVVLCTPTVIGEKLNNGNPQDADLNAYADVVRRLAELNNCSLVDLRKVFITTLEKENLANKEQGVLTNDRVHLNEKGNNLVAEEMMKAIESLYIKK